MANNRKYFPLQKFHRLTLVQELKEVNGNRWLFLCECGNYKIARISDVKCGDVKSCGCLVAERKIIHTRSEKLLHQIFHGMKARCYNPNNKQYKDYGGRGIKICEEWLKDPLAFINWSLNNGWQCGLAIDRRDNNGGYNPTNCRFVSRTTNNRNTRRNVLIEYKNETKCLAEWCEILHISYKRSYDRLNRLRWPVGKVFCAA